MEIVQAPDSVLATPAKPIKKIDKDILKLIEEMKTTLLEASDPEGVGLAAPQVGHSLQLFITKPERNSPIYVYMNPQITHEEALGERKSKEGHDMLEGCLSIKDVWGTVKRYKKITLTYMDEHGKTHTETFTNWPARVIQHEFDHLQGILFPRRVLEQQGKLYKSHKNKNGEEIFDLVEL